MPDGSPPVPVEQRAAHYEQARRSLLSQLQASANPSKPE